MALFEIKMPKLGESITEGPILSWSVKVGDNVQEDDVLFEVSTAKVSAEIPSPIAGQVHDIFFAEGDTVAVGTVVATIRPEDDEDDESKDEETGASATTEKTEASRPAAAPSSSAPLSQPSSAADSAKAASASSGADAASPSAGASQASDPTPAEPNAGMNAETKPEAGNTQAAGSATTATPPSGAQSGGTGTGQEATPAADRWYSPLVLQLAQEARLSKEELDRIPGTGFEGRLSKKDIQQYIQQKQSGKQAPAASRPDASTQASAGALDRPATQPAGQAQTADSPTESEASAAPSASPATSQPTAPSSGSSRSSAAPTAPGSRPASAKTPPASSLSPGDTRVEMDRVRRMIADHMVMSKQVSPHVTSVIEIDVTRLVRWRARTKEEFFRREGIKLTYMPAIAEATAKALAEFPALNASVDGYSVILKKHINLGIAVSLDDGNLIVPVIADADKLNLGGLASAIDTLAAKARHNKLAPSDIQGGTFTITNFGTFKSLFGTPIINQPEVAILAVGYIEKKPAVVETPEGDTIAVRHKMYLSLSYDHRVIDGALGGSFLRRIGDLLENWNV